MTQEKESSAALNARTADELLGIICQGRVDLLKYNRLPDTLYLGEYEYSVLKAFAQQYLAVTCSGELDRILGLEIIRVQRASHLKVTD